MGFGVHLADQIDQRIDAYHLDGEEHPFGRPDPNEVVDQAAHTARTGHGDRIPDAGPGNGADDVRKHQQKHAVLAHEVQQLWLVLTIGFGFQQREQK